MAILYLVVLTGWLLVVGVLRSAVHQRSAGTAPVRFNDRPGSPQWGARVLGTLGLVFAVATPLADLVGLDPVDALDHAGVAAAGVVLVVAGVGGAAISQATMGSSWRGDVDADVRTDLVVHGPFRWVRNPIFSATAVTVTGLALIVPNVVAAAMIVFSVASWHVQVRLVEEPYLRRMHGTIYDTYAERTGRFLPGIGRLRSH
jgi:protein-S-isoprenylcysteine O-methyltransferase Ste14